MAWLESRRKAAAVLGLPLPEYVRLREHLPLFEDLLVSDRGDFWIRLSPWPSALPLPSQHGDTRAEWLIVSLDGQASRLPLPLSTLVLGFARGGPILVDQSGPRATISVPGPLPLPPRGVR